MSDLTIRAMLNAKQEEFDKVFSELASQVSTDRPHATIIDALDRVAKRDERCERLSDIMLDLGFIDTAGAGGYTPSGNTFNRLCLIANQMQQIRLLGSKQDLERQRLEMSLKD